MHEIRMFELDGGACTTWRVKHPQVLKLVDGLVWVTIEGEPTDHWLGPHGYVELTVGSRVWLSAESSAVRFALLEGRESVSEHSLPTVLFDLSRARLRNILQVFGQHKKARPLTFR